MKPSLLFTSLFCLLYFSPAQTNETTPTAPVENPTSFLTSPIRGEIRSTDSEKGKLLFNFSVEISSPKKGSQIRKSEFLDPEGQKVLTEEAEMNGAEFISSRIEQLQLGKKIEIKKLPNRRLQFSIQKGDQKPEIAEVSYSEPLVMVATFQTFLVENWEKVLSGETIKFDLGVWQRKEALRFRLQKIGKKEDRIELKMEISNRLLAFILPTAIIFETTPQGQILRQTGRMQPLIKKNNRYLDLEAEALFFSGKKP